MRAVQGRMEGPGGARVKLGGHVWTVLPWLLSGLRAPRLSPAKPWSEKVCDKRVGSVPLSGLLHEVPGADGLAVVVHGLGGSANSWYVPGAVAAALNRGFSCLRLNLRGADREGGDIYHAGLTDDLDAAVGSSSLSGYSRVVLLGYSMGGHVVLRYAALGPSPRVAAVAAVCAPLHLGVSALAFDTTVSPLYRHYVMRALSEMYAATATSREPWLPVREARAIRSIREWDDRVVAPRFGFRDAAEYYATQSVAPVIGSIQIPALLVLAKSDPMVVAGTVSPFLTDIPRPLAVRWLDRGGHVGFPARTSLGEPGPIGLEHQVVSWLDRGG